MELQEIFSKVKIQTNLRSIEGVFFNEERLKLTNYNPSYQRNYVWDADKASYFIESIFIGTEVPPLIFFQNEGMLEIIDGRQRYETILKFVQNKLRLKKSGLPKLGGLDDFSEKTYGELNDNYKNIFKKTRLRIMEFSFIYDNHTPEDEEKLKHEIFQRYNTGITPLKSTDVGKAEYSKDDLVQAFSEELDIPDKFELVSEIFHFDKISKEILLQEIRELLVINMMPITFYAQQTKQTIKRYFNFISDKALEEGTINCVVCDFFDKINIIKNIMTLFKEANCEYNRLYSECLYWALSIIKGKNHSLSFTNDEYNDIVTYLSYNSKVFTVTRSSFASSKKERYEITALFFSNKYKIDFRESLTQGKSFQKKKDEVNKGPQCQPIEIRNLHRYKQEPTTYDITDIFRMVEQNKYLIRPPYQRNEVISRKKASSIIESLLLDIKLPPIFVYARQDDIYEVIDGQQRLLSILAYLKKPYKNESGELEYSKNNGFALNLRDGILKTYHGKLFEQLSASDQQKIKSAGIWIVEISALNNEDFDPIDLFVRLNNKPYPIKADTFEMWNSYIKRNIIDTVKEVYQSHKAWFYLRKTNNVRMDNENILTILSYFYHVFNIIPRSEWIDGLYPDKTMDIFMSGNKLNCRLKSKIEVSRFLEKEPNRSVIDAINSLEFSFISKLELLVKENSEISSHPDMAKTLDNLMCVENGKRTIQGFYILWLLLYDIPMNTIEEKANVLGDNIKEIFKIVRNVTNKEDFVVRYKEFKKSYAGEVLKCKIHTSLGNVLHIATEPSNKCDFAVQKKFDESQERIVIVEKSLVTADDDAYYVEVYREGFSAGYIKAIILGNRFYATVTSMYDSKIITKSKIQSFRIPYVSSDTQNIFEQMYKLIDLCKDNVVEYKFFLRILNIMTSQLYDGIYIDIDLIELVKNDFSVFGISPDELYATWSSPSSMVLLATYRAK